MALSCTFDFSQASFKVFGDWSMVLVTTNTWFDQN